MGVELVIADDHEVVRAGLVRMLEGSGICVIGEAEDGDAALAMAIERHPAVVLLDVRMPNMDGLDCLARLRNDSPGTSVLMFSGFDNPTYVARAVALGAAGFLLKTASRAQIIAAILAVADGETIWSRDELRRVSGALASPRALAEVDVPLTKRESEVLKQLAFGLTNKEIAQALGISYETVKEHVQHVLKKLGVADRTQAAVWAVRNDLV
jgi:DNA-binding NarL/FixJ family response regulator